MIVEYSSKETQELQDNMKKSVIRMIESDDTFIKSINLDDFTDEGLPRRWIIEARDNRDNPGL